MIITHFSIILLFLLLALVGAVVQRRAVIAFLATACVLFFWGSISVWGAGMETFEDDYFYLTVTEGVVSSGSVSGSEEFLLNTGDHAVYFVYHVVSAVLYEVLGLADLEPVKIYKPVLFFFGIFCSAVLVYSVWVKRHQAVLGGAIFVFSYPLLQNQNYNPFQATTLLFVIILYLLVMYLYTSERRWLVLLTVLVPVFSFSHYAKPLLLWMVLVFGFASYFAYSKVIDALVERELSPLSDKAEPGRLGVIASIFVIGFLILLAASMYLNPSVYLTGSRSLIDIVQGGLFTGSEQSATVRQLERSGKDTILNETPLISLLFFGTLSVVVSVRSTLEGRRISILAFLTGTTLLMTIMAVATGWALGVFLLVLFFLMAGLVSEFVSVQMTQPVIGSGWLSSNLSTFIVVLVGLLLFMNLIFVAPPSKIDESTDLMDDGYNGVEPIGKEFKYTGYWIDDYINSKQICTTGKLRGSVFYYGQNSFPCWLSQSETQRLQRSYVVYDQQRLYQPEFRANRIYDTGRTTVVNGDNSV